MGRQKKNLFINGRYDLDECATCKHEWGSHAFHAPHKCCRQDCDCPEFKEQPKPVENTAAV
jgi:hypothetical protein